jgi:hypothetical protein
MDERQAQIREGAGLDEARLNVEFIEFLKKWSTPILVIIAVIALGYYLFQQRKEVRKASLNSAFTQLDAARGAGNPVNLLGVADDNHGKGAVTHIAHLAAADIYLASFRSGVRPGGRVDNTGKPEDAADILTEDERKQQLERAAELYQTVITDTSGNADMVLHTLGGYYGLATVAECKGDMNAARQAYGQVETLAKGADLQDQAKLAAARIESLTTLATLPRLYARSEIPVSMQGQLPEGLVPVPNPFANQTPATATPEEAPAVPGPVGPAAPGVNPPPAPAPSGSDPETGAPGATPPGEKPAEEPGATPPKKDPAA